MKKFEARDFLERYASSSGRFVQALVDEPKTITLPEATAAERFSANQATWLFIRDAKSLTPEDQAELELICQRSQTAQKTYELTQQFLTMLALASRSGI